jgi:hypothetical protein
VIRDELDPAITDEEIEMAMAEEAGLDPVDLQGTPEWHAERAGCFTASIFADLEWDATPFKSGPRKDQPRPSPESRNWQLDRVVGELLTGECGDQASAKAMEWGHAMEPEAVAAYEASKGLLVELVGFKRHPKYGYAGASPDFLTEDDEGEGGGEVKCPFSSKVHARTLREGLPPEHVDQIQGGLWVTGRLWWDFISYNPKFPPAQQLYVQRVYRDEARIKEIEANVLAAWAEVLTILARLGATPVIDRS